MTSKRHRLIDDMCSQAEELALETIALLKTYYSYILSMANVGESTEAWEISSMVGGLTHRYREGLMGFW